MAENKTAPTGADPQAFIAAISDEQRRQDCAEVARLMQAATDAPPVMWGESIVGFGARHLKYESGREMDWMVLGFANRKDALTLYLPCLDQQADLVKQLGKYKLGKGCLYIKRLQDVDQNVLSELFRRSAEAA